MDGLQDWRDVAYRGLRTVGWQESCTYTDAIFPELDKTTRTKWIQITVGHAGEDRNNDTLTGQGGMQKGDIIEIHCMGKVVGKIALAIAMC